MYLRSVRLDAQDNVEDGYPFSIPAIATLERIEFRSPVTFFAGENGAGKSTLLEGIAAAARSIPVRGGDHGTEETLAHSRRLGERLTLEWSRKTRRGFFLRAEDFFDYAKRMANLAGEMQELAADFDERHTGYGRDLAMGAALNQEREIVQRYGGDLNDRSHGESFLTFFQARFVGEGLYLLDEPDTALSPQSILGLLSLLKAMVGEGAQFIIATHSAMLMAYPGASIVSFDRYPVAEVTYDDVEQIALMRSFLDRPESFLRHL